MCGYRAQRGSGRLEINEAEAELVRMIFRLKDQRGLSAYAIAKYLNARGYQTREGKSFLHFQVLRVLKHRDLYAGRTYSYAGTVGPSQVPKILD